MNQYDTQILSPDVLEQGLQKVLHQLRSWFLDNVFQKKKFDTAPNNGGGSSVSL